MVYITVRQSPIYHQMTLEEYLFQTIRRLQLSMPILQTQEHMRLKMLVNIFPARLV